MADTASNDLEIFREEVRAIPVNQGDKAH